MTERRRFEVAFAPETDDEFAKLGASNRATILKAILKKLTAAPQDYGVPLARDLAGFYKLRVGQHRVVYHVETEMVYVLVLAVAKRAEGDRENVYDRVSGVLLERRKQRLLRSLKSRGEEG